MNFTSQIEKGFIFERLWDLMVKFGYCPLFQNSQYKHIIFNVNWKNKLKKIIFNLKI